VKIDRTSKPVTPGSTGRSSSRTAATRPETPAAGGEVQLNASTQVKALAQSLAEAPTVDTARVDAIKQALAEGRYTIRPDAIAEGLLQSVKDLLKN
jgi:negative regulator of flagellin synthesis FlgM